jgi:phenylacetate-CoA ligase
MCISFERKAKMYSQLESLPRTQLRELQNEKLRAMIHYVSERVPFYQQRFRECGIQPDDIRSVDDLPRLSFTRKQDLAEQYPFGLLAVPREQVMRIHASSGTMGKSTVVCYTRNDIELFSEMMARSLVAAGARPGMILHNGFNYGLFTTGLGVHYGAEKLGMTIVPTSSGMIEQQLTLILDLKPEVICCPPFYARALGEEFIRRNIPPEEISLKYALLGAEPWNESMRAEIDENLGVRCTNLYGLTEILGPGVSQECVEVRAGSHIWEDHFYPEVVDPMTGEPLADGYEGVLVFTHLSKEAMPLLRYWTGDISSLTHEPCACGRTHVKMGPIRGRSDDLIIMQGMNLYPAQIEAIMKGIPEALPFYQIVVTRKGSQDDIEIKVEVTEPIFREIAQETLDEQGAVADHRMRNLRTSIQSKIKGTIGLSSKVTLLAPGILPRSEGGRVRKVLDMRKH